MKEFLFYQGSLGYIHFFEYCNFLKFFHKCPAHLSHLTSCLLQNFIFRCFCTILWKKGLFLLVTFTLLCTVCKDKNECVEHREGHANFCNYYVQFIMKGALRKIMGDQLLTPNIYQARKLKTGQISVRLKLETKN